MRWFGNRFRSRIGYTWFCLGNSGFNHVWHGQRRAAKSLNATRRIRATERSGDGQPAGLPEGRAEPRQLNDSLRPAWERTVMVFDEDPGESRQLTLFPSDREPPADGTAALRVRLDSPRLERPRQWGACRWAINSGKAFTSMTSSARACPPTREGTDWAKILRMLVIYRPPAPGSEWRLHRHWFSTTASADLSPTPRPDRGAPLCRVPRPLPGAHPAPAAAQNRRRLDAAQCV